MSRKKQGGNERRIVALAMKGTPEFKVWVGELADHCNQSVADATTQALRAYAQVQKFGKPMPKR
jgi:hypothetical protein